MPEICLEDESSRVTVIAVWSHQGLWCRQDLDEKKRRFTKYCDVSFSKERGRCPQRTQHNRPQKQKEPHFLATRKTSSFPSGSPCPRAKESFLSMFISSGNRMEQVRPSRHRNWYAGVQDLQETTGAFLREICPVGIPILQWKVRGTL